MSRPSSPTRALVGRLSRRHRRLVAAASVAATLTAAELVVRPVATRWLVAAALVRHDRPRALAVAAILAAAAAVGIVSAHCGQLAATALTQRVLRDLRVAVFVHQLTAPADDDGRSRLGQIANDANLAANQLASVVPLVAGGLLNSAAIVVALATVDLRVLATVTLVLSFVFAPLARRYHVRATRTTAGYLESYDAMTTALAEAAGGAPVAWRFGRPDLANRFAPSNRACADGHASMFGLAVTFGSSLAALRGLAYATAVAAVALLVAAAQRVEVLAAFLVALPTLFGAIELVAQLVDSLTIGSAALGRLAVLDLDPPAGTSSARASGEDRGSLVVRHLCRSFDSFTLGPIDLQLGRGLTAVVGSTGAGKTTLARLVAGLDVPDGGSVVVGGSSPADARRSRRLVMLPQEPHLFPGTIADQLSLADPGVSRRRLDDLATEAGLTTWLERLPNGWDTVVDAALSEGDRRITSLLQLLLSDPDVVVLDEPVAGLDALTSSMVEQAAAEVFRDRTVLMITHHIPTAERADRILVLDAGQVVGDGAHESLLDACAVYRRLARA